MLVGHSECLLLSAYQSCLSCCYQYLAPMICSIDCLDDQDALGLCNDRREVIQHTPV